MTNEEFGKGLVELVNAGSKSDLDAIYMVGMLETVKSNILKALQGQEEPETPESKEAGRLKALGKRHNARTEEEREGLR